MQLHNKKRAIIIHCTIPRRVSYYRDLENIKKIGPRYIRATYEITWAILKMKLNCWINMKNASVGIHIGTWKIGNTHWTLCIWVYALKWYMHMFESLHYKHKYTRLHSVAIKKFWDIGQDIILQSYLIKLRPYYVTLLRCWVTLDRTGVISERRSCSTFRTADLYTERTSFIPFAKARV